MVWRHKTGELSLNTTAIMGIVNLTPDSFSDGGRYQTTDAAVRHALTLAVEGAAILDLGGQSTRPGATLLSWEEEWARLEPTLMAIAAQTDVPISVDTFYPQVASRALACGASIINDVSGSLGNGMLSLAAQSGAGLVMMHTGGYDTARDYFAQALETAQQAGCDRAQLCLDVGIGFGTTREEDIHLIIDLPTLYAGFTDVPLLIGASRKRVTATALNLPVADRLPGTLALHTLAQWNGARILRVHDVKEAVAAARMTDSLIAQRRERYDQR